MRYSWDTFHILDFLDDGELKWEIDIFFFFSPFPFLSFPFLFSFLGQHVTIQLIDTPSPLITSSLISRTHQVRKHFRSNYPLQRGPGTIASTNKYPQSLRLQQTDGVRATQILSASEVLQEMTYLLLGYLHILRWKNHSYLSSVTVILGIPHFPMQLLTAPCSQQPPVAVCSPPSSFSAWSGKEINNSNCTPDW